ncbi:MAG: hypothetical protein GY754_29225 [bacterium]|nr:hypothetical protein [bacterium]
MTDSLNSHHMSIELDGDVVLKKENDILLNSSQLYEIVKILAETKQVLPDSWLLSADQDPENDEIFRITLSPPDILHVPTEPISAPEKYDHKEGSFYFDDNNIDPWDIVDKINDKLLEFGVPEDIFFTTFGARLGKISVIFNSHF